MTQDRKESNQFAVLQERPQCHQQIIRGLNRKVAFPEGWQDQQKTLDAKEQKVLKITVYHGYLTAILYQGEKQTLRVNITNQGLYASKPVHPDLQTVYTELNTLALHFEAKLSGRRILSDRSEAPVR